MPIPNGSGGYQVGSGNNSEVILGYAAAPQTATDTATLTAAQITGEMLVVTPTANSTLTLPTAALIDAAVPSARVGSTFDLGVVNAAPATYTAAFSVTGSTGVTNGGNAIISLAATTSALFRFRKTGDAAWSVYKIA
jgi:hypothetical protein